MLNVTFDNNLINEISQDFALRPPNQRALELTVRHLERGEYDPQVPQVLDLATGAGKTYVMAALIEYLRRQGHHNVMVITPTTVVQAKTVDDFTKGSQRYIVGFRVPPHIITPNDVHHVRVDAHQTQLSEAQATNLYVFNVQQLFPPKEGHIKNPNAVEKARRKTWQFQESSGILGELLAELDDLMVIIDEVHLFGESAKIYQSAFKALKPAATIGLTASADEDDEVIYRYPLHQALTDGFVKQPVLVFRKSGYPGNLEEAEDRQLQDALSLLRIKEEAYAVYREKHNGRFTTKPLLFVVCKDVSHATRVAERLRGADFFGDENAVLQVDTKHNDEYEQTTLRYLDTPNSSVRCIVNVNKLREGWDTKRIAVMCTLRAMGSEVLTQQVMGRGLRLPFGKITGEPAVDQLDILSHHSFVDLLESEDVLKTFGLDGAVEGEVDNAELLDDPDENAGDNHTPAQAGVDRGENQGNASDLSLGRGTGTNDPSASDANPPGDEESAVTPRAFIADKNSIAPTGKHPGVSSRGLSDEEEIGSSDDEPALTQEYVMPNETFDHVAFLFPTSRMEETVPVFRLDDIPEDMVIAQARTVKNTMASLQRRAINADAEAGKVHGERMQDVKVESYRQTKASVKRELVQRIAKLGFMHNDETNQEYLARKLVPLFMDNSGIEQWTEKAKESAVRQLQDLVLREHKKSQSRPNVTVRVRAKSMPIRQSVAVPKVIEPFDFDSTSSKASTGFSTAAYYGPWEKGLFDGAQFDSFSAEYKLAHLFNYDPDVEWWTRLYDRDGASIAYTPKQNYYPDFVVREASGKYWIVEGKSNEKKEDPDVLAKAEAARDVIRKLWQYEEFEGQEWGYILAFEDNVRIANSFEDLKPN